MDPRVRAVGEPPRQGNLTALTQGWRRASRPCTRGAFVWRCDTTRQRPSAPQCLQHTGYRNNTVCLSKSTRVGTRKERLEECSWEKHAQGAPKGTQLVPGRHRVLQGGTGCSGEAQGAPGRHRVLQGERGTQSPRGARSTALRAGCPGVRGVPGGVPRD